MSQYTLEASEAQFNLIVKALDFYSRIHMGQVSELTNPFSLPLPDADYSDVDTKVIELKKSMFPELEDREFYSIRAKKLPDDVRQAVDMLETIRYRISWDTTTEEEPQGIQYKKPFHFSSEMDLAKIKKVN